MRTKLTNTVIAKLAVPEGKQSVKLFDEEMVTDLQPMVPHMRMLAKWEKLGVPV